MVICCVKFLGTVVMITTLKEIGRILAILDDGVWLNNAKKEILDVSLFWSVYQHAFELILTSNVVLPSDERRLRRIKTVVSKNKFWQADLKQCKEMYLSGQFTAADLYHVIEGYNEEAEYIFIANHFSAFKEEANLSAAEIAKVMKINKNSVLSWIGHKRNMPKQAYKDAQKIFKNFR